MRTLLSYALWPALMAAAIIGNYFAMRTAVPMFWLNVNYFSLAAALLLFERGVHDRPYLNQIRARRLAIACPQLIFQQQQVNDRYAP